MYAGHYTFAAIRGKWGNNDYYIAQCPIKIALKIFSFEDLDVPEMLREIQSFDEAEIQSIARRIAGNKDDYVLNPLVVVLNTEIVFESIRHDLPEIGSLKIPLETTLFICSGQNQHAALSQLINEQKIRSDDILPVIFISDVEFKRTTNIYMSLNETTSNRSQRVLLEDNDLSRLVLNLADNLPVFRDRIEKTKTTISNRSTALFTLSALYQASQALLGVKETEVLTMYHNELVSDFWFEIGAVLTEWQQLIQGEISTAYLRENFIHSHTVTLIAIGKAGNTLIAHHPQDWRLHLQKLNKIDWSRKNVTMWEGRAMVRGRMSKARDSIALTASILKRTLGLPLMANEIELEQWING